MNPARIAFNEETYLLTDTKEGERENRAFEANSEHDLRDFHANGFGSYTLVFEDEAVAEFVQPQWFTVL